MYGCENYGRWSRGDGYAGGGKAMTVVLVLVLLVGIVGVVLMVGVTGTMTGVLVGSGVAVAVLVVWGQ